MKFILASQSPRRKEILKKMNLDFEVLNAKIDESIISKNIEPHKYSMKLAKLKSESISSSNPGKTVIGADTIVSIDDQILNLEILMNQDRC